jgi:hypothetical protein
MNFTQQIARTFSTFAAFGFLVCAYAAELGILLDDDTKALRNSFSYCYHVLDFSLASAMACVACLRLVYADRLTTALHFFTTALLLILLAHRGSLRRISRPLHSRSPIIQLINQLIN